MKLYLVQAEYSKYSTQARVISASVVATTTDIVIRCIIGVFAMICIRMFCERDWVTVTLLFSHTQEIYWYVKGRFIYYVRTEGGWGVQKLTKTANGSTDRLRDMRTKGVGGLKSWEFCRHNKWMPSNVSWIAHNRRSFQPWGVGAYLYIMLKYLL